MWIYASVFLSDLSLVRLVSVISTLIVNPIRTAFLGCDLIVFIYCQIISGCYSHSDLEDEIPFRN